MRIALLLLLWLPATVTATTMTETVSGTCGFYQGSVSNVVFSETFSGNGTFCTDFLPGGSFSDSAQLQIGDINATASHDTEATAPAGYGVFADFNVTLQATQEYLVDTAALSTPPTTPTGFLQVDFGNAGGTDDGTGNGTCSTRANVNIAGYNSSEMNGFQFDLPITFGQPFTATETASVACSMYASPGWGDSGFLTSVAEPILVLDAQGNVLGSATFVTIPEPGTAGLASFALIGLVLVLIRRSIRRAIRSLTQADACPQ